MTPAAPLLPYRRHLSEYWRDFNKEIVSFSITILLVVVGGLISQGYSDIGYMILRIKVAAFVGIIGLIQATVILSGGGGIDVSVGTMASLGALFGAAIMQGRDEMLLPALLAIAAVGFVLGLVNGLMITRLRIHPLIQTLAMSYVITGIIVAYSQGRKLLGRPSPLLERLVNDRLGPLFIIILVWVALVVGMEFLLRRSRVLRKVTAVGTNERTALLCGVEASSVRTAVYAWSGMCASLFGALALGSVHTVYLDVGNQYLFPSVVACTIGGISLAGGSGSYVGVLGGALVYTFLQSFLVTLNIDEAWRKVLFGLILVAVLVAYSRSRTAK
ncbi:MAG TPA: ABC transporter permease [Anaeromyxobacter sp.]|nr:ABC transporter permease [Anaeromyxobacter sp.]